MKSTSAELALRIKEQEARLKKLKEQRDEINRMEEAKVNAEIIKALHEWCDSISQNKPEWDTLPDYFRRMAEKNRAAAEENK